MIIIDTRSPMEFKSGHLKGAILMPHDRIGSLIADEVSDKSAEIAVYCAAGVRAGAAKQVLEDMGYRHVTNYGGVASASRKLGIEIVRD